MFSLHPTNYDQSTDAVEYTDCISAKTPQTVP